MNVSTSRTILDEITVQSREARALLQMLRVCCNLEQRDMSAGMVDGTLSDAAEGLALVIGDVAERCHAVQEMAAKLYELCPKDRPCPGA